MTAFVPVTATTATAPPQTAPGTIAAVSVATAPSTATTRVLPPLRASGRRKDPPPSSLQPAHETTNQNSTSNNPNFPVPNTRNPQPEQQQQQQQSTASYSSTKADGSAVAQATRSPPTATTPRATLHQTVVERQLFLTQETEEDNNENENDDNATVETNDSGSTATVSTSLSQRKIRTQAAKRNKGRKRKTASSSSVSTASTSSSSTRSVRSRRSSTAEAGASSNNNSATLATAPSETQHAPQPEQVVAPSAKQPVPSNTPKRSTTKRAKELPPIEEEKENQPEPEEESFPTYADEMETTHDKLKACIQVLDISYPQLEERDPTCKHRYAVIQKFLVDRVLKHNDGVEDEDARRAPTGSILISGVPGSGKTYGVKWACRQLIDEWELQQREEDDEDDDMKDPSSIKEPVICTMNASPLVDCQYAESMQRLKETISYHADTPFQPNKWNRNKPTIVMVLDEIDLLVSMASIGRTSHSMAGSERLLRTLAKWSQDPSMPFVLIGISNSVDNSRGRRLMELGEVSFNFFVFGYLSLKMKVSTHFLPCLLRFISFRLGSFRSVPSFKRIPRTS